MKYSKTFDDTRAIKVLVVPVGENSAFPEQFEVIANHKEVQIVDLSRPSSWKAKNSPLKHFDWTRGYLKYEFLRYDRMPQGPSEMENFQSSQRILVIMGIINYPELGDDSRKVERELASYAQRYPSVLVMRFFVFNYSFDPSVAKSTTPFFLSRPQNDPDAIIVLPPVGGICEGGSMIDVHLNEIMATVSINVISSLESQLSVMEQAKVKGVVPSTVTSLSTPFDDIEDQDNSQSIKVKSIVKKRPHGRMRKYMGDICLQICSPLDAMEHYVASITESRQLYDPMWLAGALDGYISSIVVLMKLDIVPLEDVIGKDFKSLNLNVAPGSTPPDALKVLRLADDRISEAILLYSRHLAYAQLEVDLTLRLARLYRELNIDNDVEIRDKVLELVMKAASVPGLNGIQQVECTLEGAIICNQLELKRKYSLFLYIAALMSAENNQLAMANNLLKKAVYEYGMRIRHADDYTPLGMTIKTGDSWPSLRRSLLTYSANLSRECYEFKYAAGCMSAFLSILAKQESIYQKEIQNWSGIQERLKTQSATSLKGFDAGRRQAISSEPIQLSEETVRSLPQSQINLPLRTQSVSSRPHSGQAMSRSKSTANFQNSVHGALLGSNTQDNALQSIQSPSVYGGGEDMFINPQSGTKKPFQSVFSSASGPPTIPMIPIQSRIDNYVQNLLFTDNSSQKLEIAGQVPDLNISDAAESLRNGLRSISVPKLNISPHLRSLMNNSIPREEKSRLKNAPHGRHKKAAFISSVAVRQALAQSQTPKTQSNSSKSDSLSPNSEILSVVNAFLEKFTVSREQQNQSWNMMEYLARSVKVGTFLELPLTPISVKPKVLPRSKLPYPYDSPFIVRCNQNLQEYINRSVLDTENKLEDIEKSQNKKSSLFYDPFAAKRAVKDSQLVTEVQWSVGVISTIVITLSNPFSSSILLDKLTLLTEGVKCKVYPCNTIEIPSQTKSYVIEISVMPLEEGNLKLRGISLFMSNIESTYIINKDGNVLSDDNKSGSLKTTMKKDVNSRQYVHTNEITVYPSAYYFSVTSWTKETGTSTSPSIESISSSNSVNNPSEMVSNVMTSQNEDNIPIQIYTGEKYTEYITLKPDYRISRSKILDFKVTVYWWINRPATTNNKILSKLNPLVKKSCVLYQISNIQNLAPENLNDSLENASDETCPIESCKITGLDSEDNLLLLGDISLQLVLHGHTKFLESGGKFAIEVEIVTDDKDSSSLKTIRNIYQSGSDKLSEEIKEKIDQGMIKLPIKLFSRIYSCSYTLLKPINPIEMVHLQSILPRIITVDTANISDYEYRLLSTLSALVTPRKPMHSSSNFTQTPTLSKASALSLMLLSQQSGYLLKIQNKTRKDVAIRLLVDNINESNNQKSSYRIEASSVLTTPSPLLDTFNGHIEWQFDEFGAQIPSNKQRRTGKIPLVDIFSGNIANPNSSSAAVMLVSEVQYRISSISTSRINNSDNLTNGHSDQRVYIRYNVEQSSPIKLPISSSITINFEFDLRSEVIAKNGADSKIVVRTAIVIMEYVDELAISESHELSGDMPKNVLINGSLSKYHIIELAGDDSNVKLKHQITMRFLKLGKYLIYPCSQLESFSKESVWCTNHFPVRITLN